MKLIERVSWLMGRLQGSLFPSFERCYDTKLTEQEERLIKILEIAGVEKHVFKKADNQWLGRKLKDREAIARAFVAKKVYKHKHTSLLIDELKRSPNLKRICGFEETRSLPCESTFSRAFSEFAKGGIHLTQVTTIYSMFQYERSSASSSGEGLPAYVPGVFGMVCR